MGAMITQYVGTSLMVITYQYSLLLPFYYILGATNTTQHVGTLLNGYQYSLFLLLWDVII